MAEVKQAIMDEWDLITEEDIHKLVHSMPQRLAAVIQAEGVIQNIKDYV